MLFPANIIFLGHDASRTGAPLVLLELIKWLKNNSTLKPSVLLKRGGDLVTDYGRIAPVRCRANELEKLNGGFFRRGLRKLKVVGLRQPDLSGFNSTSEFPVVYANTIASCDMAMQLAAPGRRIIHHIHELAYCTQQFDAVNELKAGIAHTFAYIAASNSVREYLEKTIGVPPAKIHVIHEFPIAVGKPDDLGVNKTAIRKRLGIPNDDFVIGMCGLPQWRKGTDLFVQLALHVKRLSGSTPIRLVWLGGDTASQREALHDLAQLGLQASCHFIPAVSDPDAYFNAFDLFALTSREDPFSVAMLEAAVTGMPIVCFANAGGAPELVGNDAGIVVPYLDVPAMAEACADLLADEPRRNLLGKTARAKVLEHYTLAVQGPKILAVINAAFADNDHPSLSARQL